nr:LON peptidase substrate-binding domain-containing protein [Polyangiaceae bacterium]
GQVVLFPDAFLPLHIFEPRYRAMLKHCMETHRAFAVAHVPDPADLDQYENPKIALVAGVGVVVEHESMPDGRSNILVRGKGRFVLQELPFVGPFRRARATKADEESVAISDSDRTTLLSAASGFMREIKKRDHTFDFILPKNGATGEWTDLCAHYLLVRAEAKQQVLEERNPRTRLNIVVRELAIQTGAMQDEPKGGTLLN